MKYINKENTFLKMSEEIFNNEKNYDIYTKLLNNRIIFLTGEIEDKISNFIVAQLLFLEAKDPNKEIYIYINSPGGLITSGMSIYDTMRFIKPKVNTICIGKAYSMAAFILSAGEKKKRYSLPNSRIMIHQPLGNFYGQVTDIKIHAHEIIKIKKKIIILLSKNTGKNIKIIEKDIERDKFLSPKEAIHYGLIDKIFENRK